MRIPLPWLQRPLALCALAFACASCLPHARADSVVVFNEIQYHPADPAGAEWIELHNQMAVDVDLSNWKIRGGVDFDFPDGTVIPARGYLLVSGDPNGVGAGGVLGPWTGSLGNGGERLRLRNNSDRLMNEVDYRDSGVWPVGADGTGATLAKADERTASDEPSNWRASAEVGGTPGARNFASEATVGPETVIFPIGATWRYDESGADLGADWASAAHPGWPSGAALLGYETGSLPEPIRTAFAEPAGNDIITYYFEIDFELSAAQAAGANSLSLRHVIDDGAVFYLNGTEVPPRFNMDAGAVGAATTATASVGNATFQGPFDLPAAALVAGTNRFSVKVSPAEDRSSDIVFGAELSMTQTIAPPEEVPLLISEIAGTEDATFQIEIANTGATDIDAEDHVLASRGAVDASFTIPAATVIPGGGFLVIDETQLGFRPANDDRLFLYSPGQQFLIDAARADTLPRAHSEAHDGKMLVPDAPSFGAPNTFSINDAVVINEIMYHFREEPGTQGGGGTITELTLVPVDTTWRYNESGADLGANWQNVPHAVDNATWFAGAALLGYETGSLPEPLRTTFVPPVGNSIVTYYFETEFALSAEHLANLSALRLRHVIDDGAVFYINGVEAYRFNLAAGALDASTTASLVQNAVYQGPIDLPSGGLVAGTNRLSVEVHQRSPTSSDIVFGAELVATTLVEDPPDPMALAERDEQWVELYNKGAAPVDLGGWSIDGGIDFDFPDGTMIAAGDYLVVADDATALAARYPAIAAKIVGDFRNRLNRGSDTIRLEDAVENPVDEVRYFDGGNWPERADGGGSSLELRDADADNSRAEAWAASDESGASEWQTYTSTRIAQPHLGSFRSPIGGAVPPAEWNEFVFGLLDAGEVLIDDVSVIEAPDGTPMPLIQNGTFEADAIGSVPEKWRGGGTQSATVVADPTDPANRVMRLVSTGATGYIGNGVETTFAGNRRIVTGREYQVSFRAKWIGGCRQLNNRAYFTLIPETTVLDVPPSSGTPGQPNSRVALNIGPTFSEFRHHPAVPAASQAVTVSVVPGDPDGVSAVTLFWSANGGAWNNQPMTAGSDVSYAASIPGQAAATVVQFYVEATDGLGAVSTFPAAGPDSRALYEIDDAAAARAAALGIDSFRIIMAQADSDKMHASTNLMSTADLGATLVVNERDVFYDVGVKLKGSQHSRATAERVGFSLTLHPDHRLRGVHRRIAIDRSSRSPGTPKPSPDEIIIKHFMNHAGGLASEYDDIVYVVAPRSTHNSVATLQMARLGSEFLQSQFENGDDGPIYEFEMMFTAAGTTGGVEDPKLHTPGPFLDYDVEDLGPDKEVYRFHMQKENNRVQDDFGPIIALGRALELSGPELDAATSKVLDADQWMRTFAARSLIMDFDGYGSTFYRHNHNLKFYARPADQKVLAFLWDIDGAFVLSPTGALWPQGEPTNLSKLIERPDNLHRYFGHLHDMISTTWNSDYMGPWMTHYAAKAGQNMTANLPLIQQRGNHVMGQMPAQVAFALTSNGGADISVDTPTVQLAGTGWINVREIRIDGRPGAVPAAWLSPTTWHATVPVQSGTHLLTLQAYDFQGQLIDTDTVTVTNTGTAPSPSEFLRITELHYHPADPADEELDASADPDDFEFIELQNIGTETLDISACSFDEGITFTFAAGTTLAAGESIVVVRDVAAFRARYGPAARVAGSYAPTSLSNAGETLTLRDATGTIIQTFAWDDAWFPATDGGGYALVARDPTAPVSAWSSAAQWAIGATPGGTPGTANGNAIAIAWQFEGWRHTYFNAADLEDPLISGALATPSGNGITNLLRYALAFNATEPASALLDASINSGQLTATYRQRKNLLDVEFTVEATSDNATWSTLADPIISVTDRGDGSESVTVRDPAPIAAHPRRFLRLRVTLE